MKKNLDHARFEPFDDFAGAQGIVYSGHSEDPLPTYRDKAAFVKSLSPKDSLRLTMLVVAFREASRTMPILEAVTVFWQRAADLRRSGYLSEAQWNALERAYGGDLRAAQLLVRAQPEMLRLPFVHEAMIAVVLRQKNARPGEFVEKLDWLDFLPKRHGGRSPFLPEHLRALIESAKKEIPPSDRRKKTASRLDADEAVAEELGIKPTYLTKTAKLKTGRGRPKK